MFGRKQQIQALNRSVDEARRRELRWAARAGVWESRAMVAEGEAAQLRRAWEVLAGDEVQA